MWTLPLPQHLPLQKTTTKHKKGSVNKSCVCGSAILLQYDYHNNYSLYTEVSINLSPFVPISCNLPLPPCSAVPWPGGCFSVVYIPPPPCRPTLHSFVDIYDRLEQSTTKNRRSHCFCSKGHELHLHSQGSCNNIRMASTRHIAQNKVSDPPKGLAFK